MQIIELMKLSDWFTETIVEGEIIDAYSSLNNIVANNARSSTKTPFEDERDALVEAIQSIDFNDLTLEQIDLLETMGVAELLGQDGVTYINSMMEKNGADIASISEHLNDNCSTLSDAQSYFDTLNNHLEKYFLSDSSEELSDDEVLIRVYFKDDASISNLEDFKKSGNDWYQIGRGFAIATDTAPEEIRVVGAEKGSVIINLVAIAGIAGILSKAVYESLSVIQRVMDIRKTKLEIDNLKLQNKKIAAELEKEIEREETNGADRIVKSLCKELKIKNDEGEKKAALKKSVEILLQFTQEGGKIDFVHNEIDDEPEDESSEQKALRTDMEMLDTNISKIRELESRLKLLPEAYQGVTNVEES